MAGLHSIALVEPNARLRQSLELVLTSTGGFKVLSFSSTEAFLHEVKDKSAVDLLLAAPECLNEADFQLELPIFYYAKSPLKRLSPIPFVPLNQQRLPAFALQLLETIKHE